MDSDAPILELTWKFKLAFGFDETDGFFLYTFPEPDEESEFTITANFNWNIAEVDGLLAYFLSLQLDNTTIQFGAYICIDMDKEAALRLPQPDEDDDDDDDDKSTGPTSSPTRSPTRSRPGPPTRTKVPTRPPTKVPTRPPTRSPTRRPTRAPTSDPTKKPTPAPTSAPSSSSAPSSTSSPTSKSVAPSVSVSPSSSPTSPPTPEGSIQYGRLSRSDIRKITNKKDLFQITAIAAASLDIDTFITSIDLRDDVNEWIPSLEAGNETDGIKAVETIVKKKIKAPRSSKRSSRRMKKVDRALLSTRITDSDHRGLRMLCDDDIDDETSCPVDTAAGEFACARLNAVALNLGKVKEGVRKVLDKFVNEEEKNGFFDQVARPLLPLGEPVPGLSTLTGKQLTPLDVAEVYVPESRPSVETARNILKIYQQVKDVADQVRKLRVKELDIPAYCCY